MPGLARMVFSLRPMAEPAGWPIPRSGIVFDPTSGVTDEKTDVIYASNYGHGVYQSLNGGASWSALTGGPNEVAT